MNPLFGERTARAKCLSRQLTKGASLTGVTQPISSIRIRIFVRSDLHKGSESVYTYYVTQNKRTTISPDEESREWGAYCFGA